MIKVIVCGAKGRMGMRILEAIASTEGMQVSAAIEKANHPNRGDVVVSTPEGILLSVDLSEEINKGDVIIDFTSAEVSLAHLDIAVQHERPIVIGTTGFTDYQTNKIRESSKTIPIVLAPNMSIGINTIFGILEQIGRIIPDGYDIEIVETHHRFKKDSPSGTALKMGQILANARNNSLNSVAVYGRKGTDMDIRKKDEIGIHAIRCGDVVGEHTIIFGSIGERIEITHKAHGRDTFAYGAVQAAQFVVKANPGLYDMQDVLGFKKDR
ncbi:MAG: 4-hydroxy-tetrahydrodipicolinate reductase [bacterium]